MGSIPRRMFGGTRPTVNHVQLTDPCFWSLVSVEILHVCHCFLDTSCTWRILSRNSTLYIHRVLPMRIFCVVLPLCTFVCPPVLCPHCSWLLPFTAEPDKRQRFLLGWRSSWDAGRSKSKLQSLALGRSCVRFAATIWHFGLLQQSS